MPLERGFARPWRRAVESLAPRGEFEGRAFHLRFAPFALAQGVSGVVPLLLFALHGPAQLRFYAMLILAFKVSVGAMLAAAIVSWCFPIFINQRAIRARNFWGLARVVPFEEIASVSRLQYLFFAPMLRVSTHQTRHIVWVPLFLVHQSEF
ncbi:MAG: hypothetical protein KY445_00195, partial [Armatimonadetes bacterium]|nr:hypothetical protein [Armatimonadota bacterium]